MNEYALSDIKIGMRESFSVSITTEMEAMFRKITGDINPLHIDDEYAVDISDGKFRFHIAFGMLTASLLSRLAGVYLPGKYSLIHSINIGFQNPVYAGDTLTICGEVTEIYTDLKLIIVKVNIINQKKGCVLKGKMKIIVQK